MWGDCSIYLNGKSLWLAFVSRWSVHLFLLQWYKCTSCLGAGILSIRPYVFSRVPLGFKRSWSSMDYFRKQERFGIPFTSFLTLVIPLPAFPHLQCFWALFRFGQLSHTKKNSLQEIPNMPNFEGEEKNREKVDEMKILQNNSIQHCRICMVRERRRAKNLKNHLKSPAPTRNQRFLFLYRKLMVRIFVWVFWHFNGTAWFIRFR